MAFLNAEEKARIVDAVRRVECTTRGEVVTVIARCSDEYAAAPWVWASLIALSVPGVLQLFLFEPPWFSAYAMQVALFAVVLLLLQWQPLKMLLIPRAVKLASARRLAREQFYSQRLHLTRERTGVLIFVSVAEHYVEILADAGIDSVVPAGTWDEMIARFIAQIKTGNTAAGFVEIVERCGEYLTAHFPAPPDDVNELPNVLIEI